MPLIRASASSALCETSWWTEILIGQVCEHVDHEKPVIVDEADRAAHKDEVAGGKACPATGNPGGNAQLADDRSGLVADACIAARRAKPDLVDWMMLLQSIREPRPCVCVNHAFRLQDTACLGFEEREPHLAIGRPVQRLGAGRIVWIGRNGGDHCRFCMDSGDRPSCIGDARHGRKHQGKDAQVTPFGSRCRPLRDTSASEPWFLRRQ